MHPSIMLCPRGPPPTARTPYTPEALVQLLHLAQQLALCVSTCHSVLSCWHYVSSKMRVCPGYAVQLSKARVVHAMQLAAACFCMVQAQAITWPRTLRWGSIATGAYTLTAVLHLPLHATTPTPVVWIPDSQVYSRHTDQQLRQPLVLANEHVSKDPVCIMHTYTFQFRHGFCFRLVNITHCMSIAPGHTC